MNFNKMYFHLSDDDHVYTIPSDWQASMKVGDIGIFQNKNYKVDSIKTSDSGTVKHIHLLLTD